MNEFRKERWFIQFSSGNAVDPTNVQIPRTYGLLSWPLCQHNCVAQHSQKRTVGMTGTHSVLAATASRSGRS